MNKDFPFTTYDFYAYLTSGLLLIFAWDFIFNNSSLFLRDDWSFVASTAVVAVAYVLGQIIAIPSSLFVEHFIVGTLIAKPIVVQLSDSQKWYQKILGFLVGRYYEPFDTSIKALVVLKAKNKLNIPEAGNIKNTESIFQVAYSTARKDEDVRTRMDDFRNQYGFARNLTFVALLIIFLLFEKSILTWEILVLLLTVSFLLFLRFLKFYAAFQAEVVRAFAFSKD